jgi:mono/diheme cytochrome c family protein
MLARWIPAVLLVSLGSQAHADATPFGDAARGELLYATHCIACHRKGLQSEIGRWQAVEGLRWNREDIADVARYLNGIYYRYPAPE